MLNTSLINLQTSSISPSTKAVEVDYVTSRQELFEEKKNNTPDTKEEELQRECLSGQSKIYINYIGQQMNWN
jgi:hypothetical protein